VDHPPLALVPQCCLEGVRGVEDIARLSWIVNSLVKGWSEHRADLVFPAKTFNQQWKANHKG